MLDVQRRWFGNVEWKTEISKWNKDNFGKIESVVFSDSASLESQMNGYLNLKPGCGYCVEFKPTIIAVLDCYTRETVGEFQIISIDYTEDLSK